MRNPAAALILMISLLVTGPAIAGPFEDAASAYARGDFGTAYHLFKPLAEQGSSDAQFHLAVMYDLGLGIPQDYAESFQWYRKAAEQGLADAQNNLGVVYECGLSVPKDSVLAYKWYTLASSRFPSSEQEKQEVAASHRDRIASRMTPAQIAEAQRLAGEWRPNKGK
jgi:hypothetical protein